MQYTTQSKRPFTYEGTVQRIRKNSSFLNQMGLFSRPSIPGSSKSSIEKQLNESEFQDDSQILQLHKRRFNKKIEELKHQYDRRKTQEEQQIQSMSKVKKFNTRPSLGEDFTSMLKSLSKSTLSLDEKEKLENQFKQKMGLSFKGKKNVRDSIHSLLLEKKNSIQENFPTGEQGVKYELNMDLNEGNIEEERETEKADEFNTERKLNQGTDGPFMPTLLKHSTSVRGLIERRKETIDRARKQRGSEK